MLQFVLLQFFTYTEFKAHKLWLKQLCRQKCLEFDFPSLQQPWEIQNEPRGFLGIYSSSIDKR